MPIVIEDIPFFGRRKPRQATPAPPAALTLVSASFDTSGGEPLLTLGFDRAVDVAGFVPGDVVVDDGPGGVQWGGTAAFEQPTPQTLVVTMIENAMIGGPGVTLTAAGGAGIVAADDDTPWAGVTDLGLPFP